MFLKTTVLAKNVEENVEKIAETVAPSISVPVPAPVSLEQKTQKAEDKVPPLNTPSNHSNIPSVPNAPNLSSAPNVPSIPHIAIKLGESTTPTCRALCAASMIPADKPRDVGGEDSLNLMAVSIPHPNWTIPLDQTSIASQIHWQDAGKPHSLPPGQDPRRLVKTTELLPAPIRLFLTRFKTLSMFLVGSRVVYRFKGLDCHRDFDFCLFGIKNPKVLADLLSQDLPPDEVKKIQEYTLAGSFHIYLKTLEGTFKMDFTLGDIQEGESVKYAMKRRRREGGRLTPEALSIDLTRFEEHEHLLIKGKTEGLDHELAVVNNRDDIFHSDAKRYFRAVNASLRLGLPFSDHLSGLLKRLSHNKETFHILRKFFSPHERTSKAHADFLLRTLEDILKDFSTREVADEYNDHGLIFGMTGLDPTHIAETTHFLPKVFNEPPRKKALNLIGFLWAHYYASLKHSTHRQLREFHECAFSNLTFPFEDEQGHFIYIKNRFYDKPNTNLTDKPFIAMVDKIDAAYKKRFEEEQKKEHQIQQILQGMPTVTTATVPTQMPMLAPMSYPAPVISVIPAMHLTPLTPYPSVPSHVSPNPQPYYTQANPGNPLFFGDRRQASTSASSSKFQLLFEP
jgi:hypothetical protein